MNAMFGHFLIAVALILSRILRIYSWIIIIRIILSWLQVSPYSNQIAHLIYLITDPFLRFFRKLLPPFPMGTMYLDFSPIIALLTLQFIDLFVLRTLQSWGIQLITG